MRQLLALLVLGATSLTPACAGGRWFPDQTPLRESGHVVRIDNRNRLDLNIYVLRSGVTHRLGLVPGDGVASLAVPEADIRDGTFQLVIAPTGSSDPYVTEPITLPNLPGSYVKLTVYRDLRRSVWMVVRHG